jgi:hypothetical protein
VAQGQITPTEASKLAADVERLKQSDPRAGQRLRPVAAGGVSLDRLPEGRFSTPPRLPLAADKSTPFRRAEDIS